MAFCKCLECATYFTQVGDAQRPFDLSSVGIHSQKKTKKLSSLNSQLVKMITAALLGKEFLYLKLILV